tara:strand:+ start:33 stop:539 length:507 start_codon:yes stop_codon:yes gene_type:complete
MAEVEYQGIKVGGGKLLLILPLLGTVGGFLWGGFELYNRLLDAESSLSSLQPESILAEIRRLETVYDLIRNELASDINAVSDEIVEANRLSRTIETETSATQREVRNDVYDMEREMQSQFQSLRSEMRTVQVNVDGDIREMDDRMREIRDELEERIQTILENPLNDVE